MPLTPQQVRILRNAGFTTYEIDKFTHAKARDGSAQHIDLTTGTWKAAIASRARWQAQKLKAGWTHQQIQAAWMRFYAVKAASAPFAFLKIEYKPPRKLSDFSFAVKLRARAQITKSLGKEYGAKLPPEWRPQHS